MGEMYVEDDSRQRTARAARIPEKQQARSGSPTTMISTDTRAVESVIWLGNPTLLIPST